MASRAGQETAGGVIRVRGARVHNLRDIDVDIPRDRLVVLTGVSGSGKSSLAFDTVFAEGQRRYIEGLSTYARQFLDQMERPDVDGIDGLPPTVSIDQKSGLTNPRSTVGTLTEILDYLRLLYARAGLPHCPKCGETIRRQTPEQIVAGVLALESGRKVIVLAPIVRGRKGQHADAFATIRRAQLLRVRVDGQILELGEKPPKLAKTKVHNIEAVVDRLVVREGIRPRLAESIDLALKLGNGTVILSEQDGESWVDRAYSIHYACPNCGTSIEEIEPRTFSFNSPHGACPVCDGLGMVPVDDSDRSKEGEEVERKVCPDCLGSRLRPEARAVTLGGRSLPEACELPVSAAIPYFEALRFAPPIDVVGPPLTREVVSRLGFLERVGLGYLTLARGADTLSGGELQRVRLASHIGSNLVGVAFVLDEPTAGLHPRDTDRLLDSLRGLRDRGNSVLVVEHDEPTIRAADWVIDIGPGAGPDGGRVVAEGTVGKVAKDAASITGRYLRGEVAEEVRSGDRLARSPGGIEVVGATEHNLKGDLARFPIGCLTCVTGVSGSGKSTLVLDILARAARRQLEGQGPPPGRHDRIVGLEAIDKQITIDQSPIGRNPRSTPATFTGLYDEIRRVYALARESKIRGYKANRFSFNVKGGRCEGCAGQGVRKVEMRFLPDLYVRCEACGGRRFNRQTLEVHYKGKSIADVLEMRVDDALDFFDAVPRVHKGIMALHDAGLGYVTLGQSSTTLSGGESQRVKLAAELGRVATGRTLYILDEPTTGLHFADVANLLRVLNRLADLGNTIVVIEHNLEVIREADWVVDLGPEGGEGGGRILVQGSPADVAGCPESHTGGYLSRDTTTSP